MEKALDLEHRGNAAPELNRELRELAQHPGARQDHHRSRRKELGNEGQRHFLHLGHNLKHADDDAHEHGEPQQRKAYPKPGPEQIRHHLQGKIRVHEILFSERKTRRLFCLDKEFSFINN